MANKKSSSHLNTEGLLELLSQINPRSPTGMGSSKRICDTAMMGDQLNNTPKRHKKLLDSVSNNYSLNTQPTEEMSSTIIINSNVATGTIQLVATD